MLSENTASKPPGVRQLMAVPMAITSGPAIAARHRLKLNTVTPALLGTVLLIAAYLKVQEFTDFRLLGERSWIHQPAALILGSALELTLGAALLTRVWLARMRKVAICVFGGFALAAIAEGILGASGCGCFGTVQISPWYTAGFDLCAVAGLLLCKPPPASLLAQRHSPAARIAFALTILVAGIATAAVWETHRPAVVRGVAAINGVDPFGEAGSLVVLEPSGWAGKTFPLASHINAGSKLHDGQWIVMLVHHDCDHCIVAVPKYEAIAAEHFGAKLAIIEMPPYAQPGEVLPITADVSLTGKLDTSRDWFAETPVAILLKDGIVQAAADGDRAAAPDLTWWSK